MSSIAEGAFEEIAGTYHWLTLRGLDRANPALLIIGGAGLGYAALAPFFAAWERDFTLVQWDQPGPSSFRPTSATGRSSIGGAKTP